LRVELPCGALDLCQCMHDVRRHALLPDGEEAKAASGLDAPQRIARDLDRPEAVCFPAGLE
jgi:hypothetical protein